MKNHRKKPLKRLPTMKFQHILAGAAIMLAAWTAPRCATPAERDGTRLAPNVRPSPAKAAAEAEPPEATIITTLGEHELFADDRGVVSVRVYEAPAGLLYAVSFRDEQGMTSDGKTIHVHRSGLAVYLTPEGTGVTVACH
jgi:hypothetical protein